MADMRAQIIISAIDQASGILRRVAGSAENASERLQRTATSMRRWGMGLMFAGGAIVGSLTASAVSAARFGDEIAKAAKRIGVSVEDLSALKHAAELSGASFSELEMGLRLLSRTADEAREGTKEYAEAWERLGVSVTDANGNLKSSEQLLLEAADAFAQMKNETEATALAQQLFGRAGTRLLPMLKQGSAGIREMMAEARQLGLVLSEEDAKAAEELTDAMHRWHMATAALWRTVGTLLLPKLTEFANFLAEKVGVITEWANRHRWLADILVTFVGGGGLLALLGGGILYVAGTIASSITSIYNLAEAWGLVAANAQAAAAAQAEAGAASAGAGAAAGSGAAAAGAAAGAGAAGSAAAGTAAGTAGGTAAGTAAAEGAAAGAGIGAAFVGRFLPAAAMFAGLWFGFRGLQAGYRSGREGQGAQWGGFLEAALGGAAVGASRGGLLGAGIGFAVGGIGYMGAEYYGQRQYMQNLREFERRYNELTPEERAAWAELSEDERRRLVGQGFAAIRAELGRRVATERLRRMRQSAPTAGAYQQAPGPISPQQLPAPAPPPQPTAAAGASAQRDRQPRGGTGSAIDWASYFRRMSDAELAAWESQQYGAPNEAVAAWDAEMARRGWKIVATDSNWASYFRRMSDEELAAWEPQQYGAPNEAVAAWDAEMARRGWRIVSGPNAKPIEVKHTVDINVRGDPETMRVILRDPNARAEFYRAVSDGLRTAQATAY